MSLVNKYFDEAQSSDERDMHLEMMKEFRMDDDSAFWLSEDVGVMMDYAVNCLHYSHTDCAGMFARSTVARCIEISSPRYIYGLSGIELWLHVERELFGVEFMDKRKSASRAGYACNGGPEWWVGSRLLLLQWRACIRFADILERIPIKRFFVMYPTYHEMDDSHFLNDMLYELARM